MKQLNNSVPNTIRHLLIAITLLCCSLTQGSQSQTPLVQAEALLHQISSLSASAETMTQALMLYHSSQGDPRYEDKMDAAKQAYLSHAKQIYAGLADNHIPIQPLKATSKQFYSQYQKTKTGALASNYTNIANQLLQHKSELNKTITLLTDQLQQAPITKPNPAAKLAREQLKLLQQMTEFYMTMYLDLENPNPQIDIDEQAATFNQNLATLKSMPTDEELQAPIKVIEKKWSFVKRSVSQRGKKGTPELMQRFSEQMTNALLEVSGFYSNRSSFEVAADNP